MTEEPYIVTTSYDYLFDLFEIYINGTIICTTHDKYSAESFKTIIISVINFFKNKKD